MNNTVFVGKNLQIEKKAIMAISEKYIESFYEITDKEKQKIKDDLCNYLSKESLKKLTKSLNGIITDKTDLIIIDSYLETWDDLRYYGDKIEFVTYLLFIHVSTNISKKKIYYFRFSHLAENCQESSSEFKEVLKSSIFNKLGNDTFHQYTNPVANKAFCTLLAVKPELIQKGFATQLSWYCGRVDQYVRKFKKI